MYKITVDDVANKRHDEIFSYGALMQVLPELGDQINIEGQVLCLNTKAAHRLQFLAFYAAVSTNDYLVDPNGLVALQQMEANGELDAEAKIKITVENMITGETKDYAGCAVLIQTLPTLADKINVDTKVYCTKPQVTLAFPHLAYFAPIMAHNFMRDPNGFAALAAAEAAEAAAANEPADDNKNESVA